ncbi:MAG: alpha/beta hydrolase [Litorimonas sp.]
MIKPEQSPEHIVFVPGFMCDGQLFRPQIEALNSKSLSYSIAVMTEERTFREMAERILETAPENFAIVGLSMGGIIALEVIKLAPERVTHLALLNTTPHEDKSIQQRKAHIQRVREGELETIIRDELKPRYLSPSTSKTTLMPLVTKMGETLGLDVFIRQSVALMIRKSKLDQLSDIHCPTLVLTGDDDTLCPPSIHLQMSERIPNSHLEILPNCGHLSTLEAPEAVTKHLFEHWNLERSNLVEFPNRWAQQTQSV